MRLDHLLSEKKGWVRLDHLLSEKKGWMRPSQPRPSTVVDQQVQVLQQIALQLPINSSLL